MNKAFAALALSLQLSLVGLAQAPANPTKVKASQEKPTSQSQEPTSRGDIDVVKITTNLVQVDAVITDKSGRPVTDLRSEEVEILEDGKPQKVTNFSFVSVEDAQPRNLEALPNPDKNAPPAPPVRLRPEQVRRTIALVVDDLGLSFESAYYVRRALKKFVDEQVQPGDLIAIIRTAGGIGALQQFTSDKQQLYAAVERVKWNPTGRGGIAAFTPIGSNPSSGNEDADNAAAELDEFREEIFSVGTLGAINYVIRGMRELPGRKSILLLSDGIRIFNRSDPTRSDRLLAALRGLTDLANRASVVIYTMDARGLQTLGITAADATSGFTSDQIEQQLSSRRLDFFESQNGLNYLAERTGGFFLHDNNDLAGGIRRVIEDQKSYYLIGYRPEESTFEPVSGRRQFHKLGLKVLRPGKYNIRIRNGFYGVTDEAAHQVRHTAREQITSALTSPFGAAGIHLRLTSLFANDPKLGSVMRSMLHIRVSDLSFNEEPDGWKKAVFDVVAVTFGDNGQVVDQINRTHTIHLRGKTYERVLHDGFVYNLTVPIKKPGAYQMRAVLRDTISERVGSAAQFVEVPDIKKNRLTASGIVLRGMSLEAYNKALTGTPNQVRDSDDTVEESDPGANPAVRQFERGIALVYGFAIYNAQIDKATGKPRLQAQVRLFRNGKEVFAGKQIPFEVGNQTDLKRLAAGGAIQLGTQMEPGEYIFQILLTDLLAKEKYRVATRWIDFEIVK